MSEPYRSNHSCVIAAVIVLYHPDNYKVTKLIESIVDDVNKVILIDNSYTPSELNSLFFKNNFPEAIYLKLSENMGIATAQNKGIDLAKKSGCDHIIFFDQDSKPGSGMIQALFNEESFLLASGQNPGAIGPHYIDEKTNTVSKPIQFFAGAWIHKEWNIKISTSIQTDFIISSGSLIRLSVLDDVGYMRDDLFIDGVDVEWTLRAGLKGYQHFIVKSALMTHNIGDGFRSIGHLKLPFHSKIRNYYKIRNLCFLMTKKPIHWRFFVSMCSRIPLYILFFIFFSKSKIDAIKLYLRACFSGFCGKLGKVEIA